MSKVLEHLESQLGVMQGGWSVGKGVIDPKVTVCRFAGGQISGTAPFATVGLSSHPLKVRNSAREVYMELLGCSYERTTPGYGPWPGILEQLAIASLNSGTAILRGDVMRLPGPIAPGSELDHVYALPPSYWPREFASFQISEDLRVAIVWLVPIGSREAARIAEVGWSIFESDFVSKDPDVLDFNREQIA